MGVPLLELLIEDTSPGGDLTELKLTHAAIASHPPRFEVSDGRITAMSSRETVAEEVHSLSSAAVEPPGDGSLPAAILDIVRGSALVDGFLAEVVAPDVNDILRPQIGRVVIAGGPMMWKLPWEDLAPDDLRFQTVAWLRRDTTRRFVPLRRLQFPIGFDLFPRVDRDHLAEELFDDFVRYVGERGSLAWDRDPGRAEVAHHLVLDGAGSEVVDEVGTSVAPPRLVVLHLTDATTTPDQVGEVAMSLLGEGVAAVVAVAAPLGDMTGFFQPFYRKLMHNWPLEFCLWAGIEQTWGAGNRPMAARLFTVDGGEHSVALNRVIAESAAREGPQSATADGDDEWLSDDEPVGGDALESLGSQPDRPFEADRADRAATDAWRGMRDGALERANSLEFGSEQVETELLLNITNSVTGDAGAAATRAQRMTNVTVGWPGTWSALPANHALQRGVAHPMWVQIQPFISDAQVSELLDETALDMIFSTQDSVNIDIVVFSPESDFVVGDGQQKVELPRVGSSGRASFTIIPQREGWCRFRVGVYYRNTMLQSLAVEAWCTAAGGEVTKSPTIRRTTDWLASTDLQLLHELPAPLFNIFTNEDEDGTHWIGVFSDKGDDGLPLRSGQMLTFDSADLLARHKELIAKLQAVHGDSYLYPQNVPPNDPSVVAFGTEGLVELARLGRRVYKHVFEGATDAELSVERLDEVLATMKDKDQQLISIARTHGKWSLPWAAMYDLYLDVGKPLDHEVCQVFESQLAENWAADGSPQPQRADLLDDPVACRAQANCPLRDSKKRAVTVCPFGFWGFRHQIEQPLQHVTATAADQVPEEMQSAASSQASLIIRRPDEALRVAAGFFPFPDFEAHADQLETVVGSGFEWADDRDDIMDLLYDADGHHLFYFYCHGVPGEAFALEVGPDESPHNHIEAASIERELMHWASATTPQPLVILVACDSIAMRPDLMYGLFDVFRNAKASGVIGAEISIGTTLGREFGTGLVEALSNGHAVGEAFLSLRHDLLRRHNPLGLAFTSFAPGTLHIHDATGECSWCVDHGLVRT